MTKEYGDIKPGEMSVKTSLATREVTNDYGRVVEWVLCHHTAGWELAGSCARDTVEKWSVTTYDQSSNTTHGNTFLSESEARGVFNSDKPWFRPTKTTSEVKA